MGDQAPKPKPKSRRFFYIRVSVLLGILVVVLLVALRDVRSRRARNDWDHMLYVAVAPVRLENVDEASVAALRARLPALEDRLAAELARHHPGTSIRPFKLELTTAVTAASPPPLPAADGVVDLVQHSMALSAYLKDIDTRAGIEPSLYDSRIYVAMRKPRKAERTLVEGRSEQGGRVGLVELELDAEAEAVDLALIVIAHELLHTLGASDKYDPSGRTLVPQGLAEPDRVPLFPQPFAEIMGRNRMVSATQERVPSSLAEIAVGPTTAREIGWLR